MSASDYDNNAAAQVIADLAKKAATPSQLDDGKLYAILDEDGAMRTIETPGYTDRRNDERALSPRRIIRKATVLDVDSLLDYLDAHCDLTDSGNGVYSDGEGALEVWANIDSRTITGILDGAIGWRQHTVTLQLTTSREWGEWMKIDGGLFGQVEFAQFIEDHLSTIAEPAGAKLLDICQTLEATKSAAFKQQHILANGQRVFKFEEQIEARAGQKGDLTIPGELTLVLRPFQGSEGIPITARFRYRLNEGVLKLGVKLAEPEAVLEAAFAQIVAAVQERVPVHVRHGRP